jgi:hypothetical protein
MLDTTNFALETHIDQGARVIRCSSDQIATEQAIEQLNQKDTEETKKNDVVIVQYNELRRAYGGEAVIAFVLALLIRCCRIANRIRGQRETGRNSHKLR